MRTSELEALMQAAPVSDKDFTTDRYEFTGSPSIYSPGFNPGWTVLPVKNASREYTKRTIEEGRWRLNRAIYDGPRRSRQS